MIVETIVKTTTKIKICNVINSTNYIKLLKYKNFANVVRLAVEYSIKKQNKFFICKLKIVNASLKI